MPALKHSLYVLLALTLTACSSSTTSPKETSSTEITTRAAGHTLEISADRLRLSRADTIELGQIKNGEVIRQELTVRNAGEAPLVILGVQTSCGCTSVAFPKEPLRRGETAPLTFEYDSKGTSGMQIKQINIATTASSTPYIIILRAQVE